jgi:hypothetical protein
LQSLNHVSGSIDIESSSPARPSFEITADSSEPAVPGGQARITVTVTNTGDAAGQAFAQFQSPSNSESATAEYYSDDFTVVSHTDDSATWNSEGWVWDEISPGAEHRASVTLQVAEDLPTGAYTFGIRATGGDVATTTVSVQESINTEEYVRETSESLKDRLSNGTVEEVMILDETPYYVVRQIPGEQENIPAYTTTEHELLDPDRALDVAISHEYYRRYNLDAEQRLEYLTDQRNRFENVETLARIADLSGELAQAIALASIEPRAAISNAIGAVTTAVDWANQTVSDPYYEQYAKMATTCSTIDWANQHVPEPSGSLLHTTEEALEIVELTAEAAEIAETAGTAVQNIGTVVDIFSAADSVTTSVPADTVSGVEDLRTGGYAALVSLASELTVGRAVEFAEAKAKVGALGSGSFAARRPFCYEWLELEKQLRERELGPSGIIRLMAIRQTDYQIESATFHGISAIEDGLSDGFLGGINNVIFNSDVHAETAAEIATTYEEMSFMPVLATGEAFNEGTIQVENSINAAEYGDQAVIDND